MGLLDLVSDSTAKETAIAGVPVSKTGDAAAREGLELTEPAILEVRRLKQAENQPEGHGLRLGVKGGGCSGLSYELKFTEPREKDRVFAFGDVRVFVDPKSYVYLKGIRLDFQGGLKGKGFVFVNPNATGSCGCGESFSV